jgi:apolipoprotein D and lipocalin family protein
MSAAVLTCGLVASGAVWAAPPAPARAVEPERMMGRWYEILRQPNKLQKNCYAAYQVWSKQGEAYAIQQVCHRDGPAGQVAEVGALAKALNAEHTLFDASFLGGLVHRVYAVADHAPDYSWVISSTADGRFPKLLSRTPGMPAAEQAALKQRMARLGFDVSRLESCGDPAASAEAAAQTPAG